MKNNSCSWAKCNEILTFTLQCSTEFVILKVWLHRKFTSANWDFIEVISIIGMHTKKKGLKKSHWANLSIIPSKSIYLCRIPKDEAKSVLFTFVSRIYFELFSVINNLKKKEKETQRNNNRNDTMKFRLTSDLFAVRSFSIFYEFYIHYVVWINNNSEFWPFLWCFRAQTRPRI